ncbi:hydrogenase maturation protease [Streptomonospora litoralis]|uniref:Hydrogenase 2 maturation protease n=1 Tax=Streptomonospora litoralis TaxID=2498135 RepID=A0A4P6PZH7_9ACTN|nr:hydrogenase maturation protease [Streptomonospora litoralis]QBI53553.1 Hydrogenase 2 maturation protease [Streptomonospora litoralis]
MSGRTLVAGVGNIFLGDDAFGVEVARRLAEEPLPEGVRVEDFGIRGVHLAYELLNGYDALILLDAAPRGGEAGTVYVIDADLDAAATPEGPRGGAPVAPGALLDAHDLSPDAVLALLKSLGGEVGRIHVVGCEPERVTEHMGLSAAVAGAVDEAVRAVRSLLTREVRT